MSTGPLLRLQVEKVTGDHMGAGYVLGDMGRRSARTALTISHTCSSTNNFANDIIHVELYTHIQIHITV